MATPLRATKTTKRGGASQSPSTLYTEKHPGRCPNCGGTALSRRGTRTKKFETVQRYIADAVAHLRAIGEPAPDTWLAHTSPLSWEHISLSSDFLWDRAAATAGKRRTLNSGRVRIAA
jgi:hypothetical protein